MKKLLGMTLALAMIVPAGANAELLKNLKVSGNLDIQTTSARNVVDLVTRPTAAPASPTADNYDRIGTAVTRVIVKLDWDILDDVHSRVTLVKGAQGTAASSLARKYGAGAQDLNVIQSAIVVEEANVKIDKVMGLLDLTAGRQFYGEEGDLVIYYGPRDAYGQRVDAIDMFRADWNGEHMSVTGIAGKTSDAVLINTAIAGAATDLRGVTVSCKMHEMVKPSLYVYNEVTHGGLPAGIVIAKNTNLWVAGVKAKFATGGLTASVELAQNFGEDRGTNPTSNFKGTALQAKVAYKLDLSDVGMITPWAEWGKGSGDNNGSYAGNNNFRAINTDYRPGAIYGRFDTGAAIVLGGAGNAAASNGLANRTIWGFGLKATPAAVNKLTVGAQFYHYEFSRLADNGQDVLTPALPRRNSRNIGTESDVTAEWKHSENVSFKAAAGSFLPGTYWKDVRGANAALNPVVMLSGDVAIKF